MNSHQNDAVINIAVASKSKKVAAGFLLLSGFMILWITSIFAAQIKYEFYFDQTYGQLIGAQVGKFSNFLWKSTFFKAKLNVDKVRFEWGGCIYAGWVVACLEICTAGGMWHFRGFAPERRQEKDNEIQENLLLNWYNYII